jgi:hypothetical protein
MECLAGAEVSPEIPNLKSQITNKSEIQESKRSPRVRPGFRLRFVPWIFGFV